MSSRGQFNTPKKKYASSADINTSSCRLCGSVKDATHCKNLFAKANRALLVAAEDIFNSLPCHELMPHLLCRSCEGRLKNYVAFKTLIAESKFIWKLGKDEKMHQGVAVCTSTLEECEGGWHGTSEFEASRSQFYRLSKAINRKGITG